MKNLAILMLTISLLAVSACTNKYGADSSSGAYSALLAQENIADRVFFPFDSSSLDETAKHTLEKHAALMKMRPEQKFLIEGHCDLRGPREYNIALGERRAHSAKMYLELLGVTSTQLTTVSYGKERPAVTGEGESVWSQNRRAVVVAQ